MSGLILKDLLILRKSLRSYLFILAIYAGIAFSGVWSADIVGVLMVVVVMIVPMNTFAYDKQAKWDTYGLALPVGRTKTVAARYLCVLLLCVSSVALTALLGAALWAAGRVEEPVEFLVSCSVMGLISILMNAIMLPLLYKFGAERARMMFYGVLGCSCWRGRCSCSPWGAWNGSSPWRSPSPPLRRRSSFPLRRPLRVWPCWRCPSSCHGTFMGAKICEPGPERQVFRP